MMNGLPERWLRNDVDPASTLENTLKDLPTIGRIVKDRAYRQVWRFEHEGRAYYLKFYPRESREDPLHKIRDRFRRWGRGSHAMLEFMRLQSLQRAGVPAPRAVAVMVGFRIGERRGDAVIIEAIEPSVQLDVYLRQFEQLGRHAPDHRDLSRQVREMVQHLVKAKLGHEDLHLGNFLLHDGQLYLLDGYSVRRGMRPRDLFRLAHSAAPFATTTDLLRAWNLLGGGPMPRRNPISESLRKEFLKRIGGDDRYFGRLRFGQWSGNFFRYTKFPKTWSAASRLTVTTGDWERLWPELWGKIERDELQVLKRTKSGDVLAGEIELAGQTVPVIIKRPRKRYWYRYIYDAFRASRSWRAWEKAWNLITRNLPTAWPILVMEKRRGGYVTDSVSVFERVPGPTLRKVDLDALCAEDREMLFRRTGRILRTIDTSGMSHFDAKASNFIVRLDAETGPFPVLIDTDAVRFRYWPALGLERLLRSMKEHEQYTPGDSLALCLGYAPYSAPKFDTDAASIASTRSE
jgi:tRNA A-37 threonylcarbamoyl transferase component Bud32